MIAVRSRFDLADLIDDIHSLCHLAENAVAVTRRRFGLMIKKIIVHKIDEELRRGAVHHVGTRHCDSAAFVGRSDMRS